MAIYDQISYSSGGNAVKKPKKPLDTETYKQMVAFGPAEGEQATTGKTSYTQPATPAAATSAGNGSTQPAPSQSTQAPAAAAPEAVGKGTPGTSGQFSYGDYTKSDAVRQAEALLQQQLAQKPGQYQSPWQTQLDDTIQKIMNREDFSYDFNADALYQQYKDNYIQQGRMAMMDTMGQAQAMTGGYGSSYAQMVGQQAYNQQLGQLNDVIPELYQLALNQYLAEGDQMYDQAALLAQMEGQDYDRYRDQMGDWQSEVERLQGRYDAERDYDYGMWADGRDFDYQQDQDKAAKELEAAELAASLGDYSLLAKYYGWTDEYMNGLVNPEEESGYIGEYVVDDQGGDDVPVTYESLLADVTYLRKNGATGRELFAYLQQAVQEGKITQEQAAQIYRTGLPQATLTPTNRGSK